MSSLPASIHNAIIDGVQRLYVLRLDGAPADDTLPLTICCGYNKHLLR